MGKKLKKTFFRCEIERTALREGTFFIGGGGGGLRRGGSPVNFLQVGEGQTCFIRNWGRITFFFGKENITPCHLIDSYLLTNSRSV